MNRRVHWSILLAGGVILMTLALIGDGRLRGQKAEAQPISTAGSESLVYVLDLQGEPMGEYIECSGLGSHHEIEERAVVAPTGSVIMQGAPGALQWHRIALKRSAPGDIRIWQWRKTMEEVGLSPSLREGRITLYQAGSMQPLAQWTFRRGWPASLTCDGGEEELVIVHEGLTRSGTTGTGGTTTPSRR